MSLQGIVSATFSQTVLYVSITVQHNVLLLFVYCLCIEQKYIFIENFISLLFTNPVSKNSCRGIYEVVPLR